MSKPDPHNCTMIVKNDASAVTLDLKDRFSFGRGFCSFFYRGVFSREQSEERVEPMHI